MRVIKLMLTYLSCIVWTINCVAQLLNTNTYAKPNLSPNVILATAQELSYPTSIALDGSGGFYVSCLYQRKVFHVTTDGKLHLVAGNGTKGFSGDGGQAASAQLNYPRGVAVDSAGNLYIADSGNNRIRKVTPVGTITTVAGNGEEGFGKTNGLLATSTRIHYPEAIAMDSMGNIYFTDSQNLRICKINSEGMITTVADIGPNGIRGDDRHVNIDVLPFDYFGIVVDSTGNIFFSDAFDNRICKVTPAGRITTIAGNGTDGFSGDGGQATAAQLSDPSGIAIDSTGNLFVADTSNESIRKITPAGVMTTIAGNGTHGFSGDGGQATAAQLGNPSGIAVDSAGNLYIADSLNNRIRKITPDGVITTVAGNGEGIHRGQRIPAEK